jgi:hypothetical protein
VDAPPVRGETSTADLRDLVPGAGALIVDARLLGLLVDGSKIVGFAAMLADDLNLQKVQAPNIQILAELGALIPGGRRRV